MKSKARVLLGLLALLATFLTISAQAAITVPASGTGFTGTLTLQEFVVEGGQLVAVSTLAGTLTTGTGTTNIVLGVDLPVDLSSFTATCQTLHLEVGPLDLNLLGVAIHADALVIDVNSTTSSGLRRGLLCAIGNAGDNPTVLARHLNQLLTLL